MRRALDLQGEAWNQVVRALPGAHVLQSWEWAQAKKANGWESCPLVWEGDGGAPEAAALVLKRPLRVGGLNFGVNVLYAPRGPLLDWANEKLRRRVLDDLQAFARAEGAIMIKMDPEVQLGVGVPGTEDAQEDALGMRVSAELMERGWRYSDGQVQFKNTVWVNVDAPDEVLLGRMKQKTRYNLRLAERKGVVIRSGGEADLADVYRMYAETSVRDGFVIRGEGYYRQVWERFLRAGMAEVLLAGVGDETVAGLILFHFGGRAWYLYGMSRNAHREAMPNYLLQWEAMRLARAKGCNVYDLWGAPDRFEESDSMWGVYRFKEGLGGRVIRTLGAWDFASRPWFYSLYTRTLPRLLALMRRRGKARTRQEMLA